MSEKFKRENTDEIICPHCDYEFDDSYESIPRDSDGEATWVEECPECDKKFNVSFDCRNIDDGYSTRVMTCEEADHKYKLTNTLYESTYRRASDEISIYSKIEVCTICDKYKFTPVKDDGSDFTEKEFLDFKIKKRLANKPKIYSDFNGIKTGVLTINKTEIRLPTEEPEGNLAIWVKLCRWFISKGFKPQQLPDFLRKSTVSFKRDWLECEVSLHNYSINVEFYQNEILKSRKKGDGRYEHNKYDLLTDTMKAQLRASMNMVKKYFIDNGFECKPKETDTGKLLDNLKVSDLSEWTDPTASHYNRDRQDRDKKLMKSGDLKYFYDRKTLKRGVIWWNNGNQWYVMCNGELNYTSHFRLFDYTGEPSRKPLTKDEQIQRLHTELTMAEKSHNYDKCKALWKMLESYKLYNVWSLKHESWWGGNNSGYTKDKVNAGVYAHENIMNNQGYYNDGVNSKAILI